jgi:hypothetical protein
VSWLSPAELAEIERQIPPSERDYLYTRLYILGRAGPPKYRALMERYLHYVEDPMIRALALNALCNWWSRATEY